MLCAVAAVAAFTTGKAVAVSLTCCPSPRVDAAPVDVDTVLGQTPPKQEEAVSNSAADEHDSGMKGGIIAVCLGPREAIPTSNKIFLATARATPCHMLDEF